MQLRRSLGPVQVTASALGIIIGAGIYVLLGAATAKAGNAVWMSFAVAGGLSALTALSYAELASMYPSAGAEYEYTRHGAPEWVAFLVGWMMIFGLIIAAATVSLGFAGYCRQFVPLPRPSLAIGLLVCTGTIAMLGGQRAARLTVALSLLQVFGLVAIVVVGIPHLGDHDLVAGATPSGVLAGAALVFFAFIGFDEAITLASETREPYRTVPRALLVALGIATMLYVAVGVAAVSVLGSGPLARTSTPLAAVMRSAIGPVGGRVMALAAMVATVNTTLLVVTAASRLTWSMASTGSIPRPLSVLNRFRVPARSVVVVGIVAAVTVVLGRIELIAGVTDFAVFLVFLAVNAGVIVLRFRQPNHRRPFRIPVNIGKVPVPAVGALVTVVVVMPTLEPKAIVGGSLVLLAGAVAYGLMRRHRPMAAPTSKWLDPMMRRTQVTMSEAARVADLLAVDFDAAEFDLVQFHRGLEHELQHGRVDPDTNVTNDDLALTAKIALAHLNEIPDYYTRLEAMEADARAYWGRR